MAFLVVSCFGFDSICCAESVDKAKEAWGESVNEAKLNGAKEAEMDFGNGSPKVASFGTEVCELGFGAPQESKKILVSLPRGKSYCGCIQPWSVADEAYIAAYNNRMSELLENQQVNKSLDGSATREH
jgi:hypothetical protein